MKYIGYRRSAPKEGKGDVKPNVVNWGFKGWRDPLRGRILEAATSEQISETSTTDVLLGGYDPHRSARSSARIQGVRLVGSPSPPVDGMGVRRSRPMGEGNRFPYREEQMRSCGYTAFCTSAPSARSQSSRRQRADQRESPIVLYRKARWIAHSSRAEEISFAHLALYPALTGRKVAYHSSSMVYSSEYPERHYARQSRIR